ncbi:odorant receptor 13a [Diachasma alloeum]|uniref:Odorant receptor n=1 Tax=Diachasma alloeum TaxID=454923 RepID=A0A4E0RLT2_9HYME|nr:odorant receptor 13a [Diachasma alloeum]THK33089.1 odorant receptor 128 [Diachasma alloeum]
MKSILDSTYYRPTRWGMRMMGQWPFQSAGRNRFFKCLTIFLVTSICVPTMIKFVESLDDIDVVMESIPMFCVYAAAYIKFFTWAIDDNSMRELLLSIERDWKNLKVEEDIQLLAEFSERGRKISNLYTMSIFGFLALFLTIPAIPMLMDIWIPLNESRSRIFLYQTEYFVDQNEYYFLILIHAYLTIPVVFTVVLFFDNLFSIFVNHTCGMCNILKLHLECVHIDDPLDKETTSEKRIQICADMQTNILEFVQRLESICTIPFLLLVGMNMLVITSTGMMIVIKGNEVSEIIRFASFNIGTIFHLFWSSWQGHALIVESETIYSSVYQSEWYTFPPKLQRMLLPLMMRSANPCQITAGKFYVMSMESFGAAMRMTMSFFTLLLSMR